MYSDKCFRSILNVFRTIGWGTITYPKGAKVKVIKCFRTNNLYSDKCFRTILNVFRTIGWGTITYSNGAKVKEGDTCTQAEADRYLEYQVEFFCPNWKILFENHFFNVSLSIRLISFLLVLKGKLLKKTVQSWSVSWVSGQIFLSE